MNLLFVPDFVPDGLTGTGGVPVLPVDNRTRKAGSVGTRSAPAENHVLLLKDEPSCCHRDGKVWKLKEVEFRSNRCMTVASRGPREGRHGEASEEIMAFDAAARLMGGLNAAFEAACVEPSPRSGTDARVIAAIQNRYMTGHPRHIDGRGDS